MKTKQHYLSDKNVHIWCPLDRNYMCNNTCAWFDNEEQDCRMIGGFWKVIEAIREKPVDNSELTGYFD